MLKSLKHTSAIFSILFFLLISIAPLNSTETKKKVVFLSMDGFPAHFLGNGLIEKYMPFLSSMIYGDAVALQSKSSFPSNTPTGHASLWTGAYGGVSGITGPAILRQPSEEHTITENISGFSSLALKAEPIYITAARQGLKTIVVSATQTHPNSTFFTEGNLGLTPSDIKAVKENLTIFDVYAGRLGRQLVVQTNDLMLLQERDIPADLTGKEVRYFKRTFPLQLQEPENSPYFGKQKTATLTGYWYASSSSDSLDRIRIKLEVKPLIESAAASQEIVIDTTATIESFFHLPFTFFDFPAALALRIYRAAPDGSEFLMYMPDPYAFRSTNNSEQDRVAQEVGYIFGNGASWPYRDGALGTILADGGDGSAEKYYVDSSVELIRQFEKMWKSTTRNKDWQLAVAYVPHPDESLHRWYGWLDPRSPAYDPEFAKRLEPYFGEILSALDNYLSTIASDLGPDGLLVLGTDHGMRGTTRTFFPNRLLIENDLLVLDERGRIDLSRTKAYAFTNFTIGVNKKIYKEGIVKEDETDEVISRIVAILENAIDPETGEKIVTKIITPESPEASLWGVGLPQTGDIFYDVAHPYYLSTWTGHGPIAAETEPGGSHGFHPEEPDMLGLMVFKGLINLSVETGDRVQNIDAAPTICDWLGIEPPRQARGRSLMKE